MALQLCYQGDSLPRLCHCWWSAPAPQVALRWAPNDRGWCAGLTAIQAGLHQQEVGAAVLLDPIDFTSQSLRVARRFLAE